jgi:hypothetical protein
MYPFERFTERAKKVLTLAQYRRSEAVWLASFMRGEPPAQL